MKLSGWATLIGFMGRLFFGTVLGAVLVVGVVALVFGAVPEPSDPVRIGWVVAGAALLSAVFLAAEQILRLLRKKSQALDS